LNVKQRDTTTTPEADVDYPITDEDEGEAFLRNYLLHQGWRRKNKSPETFGPGKMDKDEDSDSENSEQAENFEAAYNFRYEDPELAQSLGYSRKTQWSARRDPETARKQRREQEKSEKEEKRRKKEEEIRRLRNLKRNELERKLAQVNDLAGFKEAAKGILPTDLEGDFVGEEWDRRMAQLFGDSFYSEDAEKKRPKFEDSEDEAVRDTDEQREVEEQREDEQIGRTTLSKGQKRKRKQILEDMVKRTLPMTNVEPPDEGRRFRYREVSPDSYGLTPREILFASNSQLNEYVGIKKLQPYRPEERKPLRYKTQRKRRLRSWRKHTVLEFEQDVE
jgi:protein KRI1